MLALMAAPIYAKMRSEDRYETFKNDDIMHLAVSEALLLWRC
jgi:hypothetical protein